ILQQHSTSHSRYISCIFFFSRYADHRDLHSFPTRRSSDLSTRSRVFSPRRPTPKTMVGLTRTASRPSAIPRYTSSSDRCLERARSEEHTSELQSRENLVCRLLLEKKKKRNMSNFQQLTIIT